MCDAKVSRLYQCNSKALPQVLATAVSSEGVPLKTDSLPTAGSSSASPLSEHSAHEYL